jgi:hypothetical protein
MNRQAFSFSAAAVFAVLCISAAPVLAAKPDTAALKKILSSVSPAEMPSKAASLVARTSTADREAMAEAVIRVALDVNPAACGAVVGTITKAAPSTAPVVASIAASLQPDKAGVIAKAAAGAAPLKAKELVFAMCQATPKEYAPIAVGASQAAPKADKEILAAVADAVPSLKSYIQQASNQLLGQPAATLSSRISAPTQPSQVLARADSNVRSSSSLSLQQTAFLTDMKQTMVSGTASELSGSSLVSSVVEETLRTSSGFSTVEAGSRFAQMAAPPNLRPPFTPGGGTSGEINRNQTVIVQPGQGRICSQ